MTLKRSWVPFLSLLAGLLGVCPMVWRAFWPLTPLGLALFFWIVDESPSWGWTALSGYLAGLGITSVAYYWLNYGVIVYGGLPWPLSLLLFGVFSVVFGMKLPLLAVLLRFAKQRAPHLVFWTWPLAVTTTELTPLALFPWYIGNTQSGNLWLLQMADVVGVAGIAYPIAVVSMLIYRRRGWGFAISLLVLWYGYGIIRMQQIESLEAAAPIVRVEMVQPNTPVHWSDPAKGVQILDTCKRLTLDKDWHPDLVIWPEGATPFSFDTRQRGVDLYFRRIATEVATTLHAELLFNEDIHQGGNVYSAATLLDRQGAKVDTYKKVHLVAFGEYMPLSTEFPSLRQFGIYDLTPGDEIKTLSLDNGMRVAPEICYEIVLPAFTRQFVRQGADLIVNLTDDAWFGPTLGSWVHLVNLLPRAIENRVPVVRCTNSGISAILSATGRFQVPLTPLFEETALVHDVHVAHVPTLYTRWGDLFCYACALLLGLLLAGKPGVRL